MSKTGTVYTEKTDSNIKTKQNMRRVTDLDDDVAYNIFQFNLILVRQGSNLLHFEKFVRYFC